MTSTASSPEMPPAGADPSGLAVIAGATGAIGSALVRGLLAAGTPVIGFARSAEGLRQFSGTAAFEGHVADVTDAEFPRAVAEAVAGRPVRLVVNLTRLPEAGDVQEVAPDLLARGVDVKVGGLLRLLRGCDGQLIAGSRVIGFGGRLGYDPDPGAPIASVANSALASLVRQLGRELGPRGVTAHVVAPGPVDTDGRTSSSAGIVGASRARGEQLNPLGRLPGPDEVVAATLALLGAAGDLLNGGTLLLDGGRRTSLP